MPTAPTATATPNTQATPFDLNPPRPRPLTDFPEWVTLERRLTDLMLRRDAERNRVRKAINKLTEKSDGGLSRLTDLNTPLPEKGDLTVPLGSWENDYATARKNVEILTQAIEQVERDQRSLRVRLSPACLEPVKLWHRQLVERIGRNLVDLLALVEAEDNLFAVIEAEDLATSSMSKTGGPSRPKFVGSTSRLCGQLGQIPSWLFEQIGAEMLDPRADWIPALNLEHPSANYTRTPKPVGVVAGAVETIRKAGQRLASVAGLL